jgi:hypothetical protein
VLERGREVCRATDLPEKFIEPALPLATVQARSGRAPEAIALLDHGGDGHPAHPSVRVLPEVGGLGEAYLCDGRPADAASLAEEFAQIAQAIKARGTYAWALRLRAEIALHLEELGMAECRRRADAVAS